MKRIFVDMDGVLCNFAKAHAEGLLRDKEQPFPQSRFGFWTELEPIEGAIEAFVALSRVFDVWILTKPSFDNLNSFSEKAYWVNKYFGPDVLRKLIMSRNKSLLIGHYLIDDTHDTAHQNEFNGTFIHFGQEGYENWAKVLGYFALVK